MNNGKVNWQGAFPAIVSPFTKDGTLDERTYYELLELLIAEGINGVVVAGCTGESWALSAEEKLRLFKISVEIAHGRIPVIGGTSAVLTREVIELSKAAKEVGVDGVMVLPPWFAKVNRREIVHHFRMISDEARLPIMLYNLPNRTGINLTPDLLDEIVDFEWVVAIKESHDDYPQFEATVAKVGDRIRVFSGNSAQRGLGAAAMGAAGFVGAYEPQLMGREGISLYSLSIKGDIEAARRVQNRTLRMNTQVRAIGSAPANLKAAMRLVGRPAGYPRAPILDLTDAEMERMRQVVDGLGLLHRKAAE